MSHFAPMIAAILVLASGCCLAQSPNSTQPKLECNTGPVPKTFGSSQWLVYSCSDARSVVVVSAPDSIAAPFYFMFQAVPDGHRLVGEGTGSKAATDEAYSVLSKLSEQDIQGLIDQTKVVKRKH